jgi:hypothetical protein
MLTCAHRNHSPGASVIIKEEQKRKKEKDGGGMGEYIEEDDYCHQTSVKMMRLESKEEIEKTREETDKDVTVSSAAAPQASVRPKKSATGKIMTRNQKRQQRKKTRLLAMKIRFGLIRDRNSSCHSSVDEGQSCVEGSADAAPTVVAAQVVVVPQADSDQLIMNTKDPARLDREGEGEYIDEGDASHQTSVKMMRLKAEKETEKRRDVGKTEPALEVIVSSAAPQGTGSVRTKKNSATGKIMTRKQKRQQRKNTSLLAKKIRLGLIRDRNSSCHSDADERQSCVEGSTDAAPAVVAAQVVVVPQADSDQLIMNTKDPFKLDREGDGECIDEDDASHQTSVKMMRWKAKKETEKRRDVGKTEPAQVVIVSLADPQGSVRIKKISATGKIMTRKQKRRQRKNTSLLAKKIRLGLIRDRNSSCHSDAGERQSCVEGSTDAAPAVLATQVVDPQADNDQLVMNTNASFMPDRGGEWEYIKEDNDSHQTSVKMMRLKAKKETEKKRDVGKTEPAQEMTKSSAAAPQASVRTNEKKATGKIMTRKQKLQQRKKARLLAMKIRLGLIRDRNNSCHSDAAERQRCVEGSTDAAPAVVVAQAAVVANNDQLVMDTKTSFMPDARKMTSSNSSCGAILCLDVEVASDGTYSQFSQIGAVLSAGGQTSYFEAKVGKGQNGEVLRKGCLLLVKT